MTSSQTYIPDPSVWIKYFRLKRRVEQKGKGKMIPVTVESASPNEAANGLTLVSPVEAAVERVESTVKRIKRNNVRRPLSTGTSKRKRTSKKRSSSKTSTKKRTKKVNRSNNKKIKRRSTARSGQKKIKDIFG